MDAALSGSPAARPVAPGPTVAVERWPTEIPLLVLVAIAAAFVWLLLAISMIGIVYAVLLALFFFFVHLGFVTYLRGSAVRLGPEQFPDLHRRVEEIARRAGLAKVPEAYLMQADGSLNALATKFLRSRMIVLFSDLLDACGEDERARDMVIGHEIGHLKARHLDWHWLLLPGLFVPLLGAAYSRAREYTCDRWGAALCGDAGAAARGLAVLAAGGRFGPKVNLAAYVAQQRDLDTGWMTLGSWFSPYPPLSARVAAIEPALATGLPNNDRGTLRAALLLLAFMLVPAALGVGAMFAFNSVFGQLMRSAVQAPGGETPAATPAAAADADVAALVAQAQQDLVRLEEFLRLELAEGFPLPQDRDEFAAAWQRRYPDEPLPRDPFDGQPYGYLADPNQPLLFSVGPDGQTSTADDIDHPFTFE